MRRCLVVGNGPSLKDIPNEFLSKHFTFGSNRCYLKYKPDIYACVNKLVITQFGRELRGLSCPKYVMAGFTSFVTGSMPLNLKHKLSFSKEPMEWICAGHTVTYVLLQLAYWMGYEEVGLIGVDHRFVFNGNPNQELTAQGADPNHFDPNYFSDGKKWNAPDLAASYAAYALAKAEYEKDGRSIVNLTPGSALDLFPMVDWRVW